LRRSLSPSPTAPQHTAMPANPLRELLRYCFETLRAEQPPGSGSRDSTVIDRRSGLTRSCSPVGTRAIRGRRRHGQRGSKRAPGRACPPIRPHRVATPHRNVADRLPSDRRRPLLAHREDQARIRDSVPPCARPCPRRRPDDDHRGVERARGQLADVEARADPAALARRLRLGARAPPPACPVWTWLAVGLPVYRLPWADAPLVRSFRTTRPPRPCAPSSP
jgi:hypothetical protein